MSGMKRVLSALIPTILISEIIAVTLMAATWVLLSALHASTGMLIGGEIVTVLGVAVLAVIIFRRAMRIDIEAVPADD